MLTDWQNNLIDKYIRGDMTPEEKQSFERILENHEFREALEFRVATSEAIRHAGRDELRKELKTWRSNEKSGDKRISVRKVIGIAAVILVLISAGIFLYLPDQESSADLSDVYFEPFPNVISPITKGNEEIDMTNPYKLYELRAYQEAIPEFEKLEGDQMASFYQALSYLALREGEMAEPILMLLSGIEDFQFKQAADWYLALAYLQNDRTEPGKQLLEQISNNENHSYREQAVELLFKLK